METSSEDYLRAPVYLMEAMQRMSEGKQQKIVTVMRQLAKSQSASNKVHLNRQGADIDMMTEAGMRELINKMVDSIGGEEKFRELMVRESGAQLCG